MIRWTRPVNVALLALFVTALGSGVLAFAVGTEPASALVVAVHGASGLGTLLLVPAKVAIARHGLRRARPARAGLGLALAATAVLVIGSGLLHAVGGFRAWLGLLPMQLHVGAAVPFVPLMAVVGQQVPYVDKTFISPAVAPALVLVGYLMMRLVAAIDWSDPVHALPAFFIIAGVPLTFSISAGIGFGVVAYAVVMTATGRARQVHAVMWVLVPLFLVFFADNWLSAHVF
jgi:AGZA family xanthine/uracil permease-like MFS transporter